VANFSQNEIDALISCLKEVVDGPSRTREENGSFRSNATLVQVGSDSRGVFTMFVRQNVDFPDGFSVGLRYDPKDGRPEIQLFRCNGKHGEFNRGNNDFDSDHPHWDFHIHRVTEDSQDSSFSGKLPATVTTDYASFEEAVQYFVKAVNLIEAHRKMHFPPRTQSVFDFNGNQP
jgi:hypothetical protein